MDVRLEAMNEYIRPRFSADGQHFAADVPRDGAHVLVLDGREVARSDRHFMYVELAPDGGWTSYAHPVPGPGKTTRGRLVHRGVTTELVGEPVALAVTPDGEHVAVGISWGGGDSGAVVLDGKQLAPAVSPRMLTLANDGKRWAYAETISHRTGGETVTVDGVKSKPMYAAWGLLFSPDGKHVAYQSLAKKGRGVTATVVVDGRAGKLWQRTSERLQFTADGKVVYEAANAAGAWVVVGEQAHGPYRRVYGPAVTGSQVAWGAETLADRTTVLHVFLGGTPIHRSELGEFSPMHDRGPALQGLVVAPAGDMVAFGSLGFTYVWRTRAAHRVGPGEPLGFDADGGRLALMSSDSAGRSLTVVDSRMGTVLTEASPKVPEIFAETVRFTGEDVHYFASSATQLLFVRAPARSRPIVMGP